MDGLLPAPTWRVVDVTRSVNGGVRIEHAAHAVRSGHTLCGYTERAFSWSDRNPDEVGRCAMCRYVPDGYGVAQDLLIFGLTYRQLDYWCRRGYLRPTLPTPGSGCRRVFSLYEVGVAALMIRLVGAGVTVEGAHRAARDDGWLALGVRVVLSSDHGGHSDGDFSDVVRH